MNKSCHRVVFYLAHPSFQTYVVIPENPRIQRQLAFADARRQRSHRLCGHIAVALAREALWLSPWGYFQSLVRLRLHTSR